MRKQAPHPRTANINSKQQAESKRCKHQALHWLAATFPEAFDNRNKIQPLKLGIMKDILAYAEQNNISEVSRSKLHEAVTIFTRRLDYLTCLKAQEIRIDLYGNPEGRVSTEEAERAALKIKKRIEKTIKNSRKTQTNKVAHPTKKIFQTPVATIKNLPPHHYPEPTLYTKEHTPPVCKTSVKIKSTRSYDPSAIARLKEKLGISVNKEPVD
jgi:ProP effector